MDRISQLPINTVDQILSSLNAPEELVRMSVLSKTWFHQTASFPILDFDLGQFRSRESFFSYVEYTTSRFCHQNLIAHKFRLVTTIHEPAELDVVNRCLELVLEKGVKALVIDITNLTNVPNYRLPNTLLSVSVLESLTVRGCELPSSLMVDGVKLESLTCLRLENVQIDDELIKRVIAICPLLKVIVISDCHGFKKFCVDGHQNLQKVWISYTTPVEKLDIQAPNLTYLFLGDRSGRGAPQMNLGSCTKLTTVSYYGHPLPNSNGFSNFLSNFPFIENLFMTTIYKGNLLKLSSRSLRALVLNSDYDLEDMEFDTPNLVLFICSSGPRSPKSLEGKPWPPVWDLTHSKACMQCYPDGDIDALWFYKLRLFLNKNNGFKVLNLYIHGIYTRKLTELEKLKETVLPPYELEHVELQLGTCEEPSSHAAYLDAVLWCFRPQSLTLRSSFPLTDFGKQSDLIKFTYERLLQQEQGHTKIQIVRSSSTRPQKHLMDLKSKSMELSYERKKISFIKEEVLQEEA